MSRPRIRCLKPETWHSESVGRLSPHARLLFIGLITMADDEGRFRAMPTLILGHVFPYDQITPQRLEQMLAEVEAAGLVELYEHDEIRYGYLPGWAEHQRINRPTASRLPHPPSAERSMNAHGKLTEESVSDPGALMDRSLPRARACAGADRIGSGSGSTPPLPPSGGSKRHRASFAEQMTAFAGEHFPDSPSTGIASLASEMRSRGIEPTPDAMRAYAADHPSWAAVIDPTGPREHVA